MPIEIRELVIKATVTQDSNAGNTPKPGASPDSANQELIKACVEKVLEIIKAQYSAAEAQVKIKESVTGISEEMSDVGMALSRAEEKTEKMKAKAQAMDEMIDTGVLTDFTSSFGSTSSNSNTDLELEKVSVTSEVDKELAKMKSEMGKTA